MIIIALPIGAIFVVQCRSIDELYEVNRLRHHGARCVRALIYFLLKTVRLYCTCEPDLYKPKRFSNNGLNQIDIFHASVNPAGSFHVKSSGDFHGPPPILLKFGTLVGIV